VRGHPASRRGAQARLLPLVERAAGGHVEAQPHRGLDLVDVLPPRTGSAEELEAELVVGNPPLPRHQNSSATQQRRLPPAFSISSSATVRSRKPQAASRSRFSGRRLAAAPELIHTSSSPSAMALAAKAAFSSSESRSTRPG